MLNTDALQAPGAFTQECLQRGHATISITRLLHLFINPMTIGVENLSFCA